LCQALNSQLVPPREPAERTETEEAIANLRTELDRERRSVMMDWLKTVFRAQVWPQSRPQSQRDPVVDAAAPLAAVR
jgi:hypothetical protein